MAKKKLEPKSDIGKDERVYIKLADLLPNPYQPPTPIKGAWKRKLVLEEMASGVNVSIMAEGKFPIMKTFIGPLYSVVKELPEFINAAAAQWTEKESK